MRFTELPLAGAFLIELEQLADARGFFARSFSVEEFEAHGLQPAVRQCNVSYNHKAGTLRGMHFQVSPATEVKLVRCTQGSIYDVIVDVRPGSPTYLQHVGFELSADNRRMLYVPEMFAHGYQTLTHGAEVTYQVSRSYTPGCERGLRHDDPVLKISWPVPVAVISPKDAAWPLITETSANSSEQLQGKEVMR
jgi:dTDP-4-dehydrorhamnose 3,5-epimerase